MIYNHKFNFRTSSKKHIHTSILDCVYEKLRNPTIVMKERVNPLHVGDCCTMFIQLFDDEPLTIKTVPRKYV